MIFNGNNFRLTLHLQDSSFGTVRVNLDQSETINYTTCIGLWSPLTQTSDIH